MEIEFPILGGISYKESSNPNAIPYASIIRLRKSFREEIFKEDTVQGTNELSYLFRGPFASGRAFCSSMLDALLYQSFTKVKLI